jgi:hypothetical protein
MGRGGALLEDVERFAIDDVDSDLRESTLRLLRSASFLKGYEAAIALDKLVSDIERDGYWAEFAEASLLSQGKGGYKNLLATYMHGAFCGGRNPSSLKKKFAEEAFPKAIDALEDKFSTRPKGRFSSATMWASSFLEKELATQAASEAARRLLALEPQKRFERIFKGSSLDSVQLTSALLKIGHWKDLPWPAQEKLEEIIFTTLSEGLGDKLFRARLRARIAGESWPTLVEEFTSHSDGKEPWNGKFTVKEMFSVWEKDYPDLIVSLEELISRQNLRDQPTLF